MRGRGEESHLVWAWQAMAVPGYVDRVGGSATECWRRLGCNAQMRGRSKLKRKELAEERF